MTVAGSTAPRRVLLMISSLRGGGSERQTLLLLRHLDRQRFEPHLYLTERAGDLLPQVPEDVPVQAFSDVARSSMVYFPGRILRQQTAHLRDLIGEWRIDVVYDRAFPMTLVAGPAAQRLGIPRVATIVSPPERAVPLVGRRFVAIKRRRLARAYREAFRVIAVSREAARSAERYYRLEPESVAVVPNPVDRERLLADAGSAVRRRSDGKTLICVGRMTEEKGHADLLEALAITESRWPASAEPLRVQLIGDGPLRPQLEAMWSRSPHRHRLEFVGRQANPAPAIAAADALILPSRFEGLPNVVLEAMALGTPVIATRAGGTVELQREVPTIFWAEPADPESLAAAILRWADDSETAARQAEAARQLVAREHDPATVTRRIEQHLWEASAR